MRVAVIGAGPAGLACAVTLERLGVETVVYEQKDRPGQIFAHVGVIMPVMHRPAVDLALKLKDVYGIDLKPVATVRRVHMYGPSVHRDITGPNLGFTIEVSRSGRSVTGQLAGQYHGPVLFNTRVDYFALRQTFDYVVVASGNPEVPAMVGVWQDWLRTWTVGAQVLGEFDPTSISIWLDRHLAKNGYGYMIPFNDKMASLILVVPSVRRTAAIEYWRDFLRQRGLTWPVATHWDTEHITGYVHPLEFGNTLFVGHAGGFMDPLLGFSLFTSMASGVLAARSIATGESFTRAVTLLRRSMLANLSLRRVFDRMENKDLDRLVVSLALPGISQLVYNSRLNFLRAAAVSAGWYRDLKGFLWPAPAFGPRKGTQ